MAIDLVRARKFITPYEGWEPKLYQDVKGLVTCGTGNLVTAASVLLLPWVRDVDGAPAAPAEIADAFATVQGSPRGHGAAFYRQFSKIHLTDQAIADLFASRIAEFSTKLRRIFPSFESWPADAQLAETDMVFNLGADELVHGFPTHVRVLRSTPPDFRAAAASCHRVNTDRTVAPWDASDLHEQRQIAVRDLFLSCARASI